MPRPQYIHRRNIKFKNEISKSDKKRILGVAIDPSKQFHRVAIFDFRGKIIFEPFSINTFLDGYQELKTRIKRAYKKISAVKLYVAIEMPASYSDNLIRHLQRDFRNVVFVPPTAVANNREQKGLHGLKTDNIDIGAIGDLLIRGEFSPHATETGIYFRLKESVYWREKKMQYLIALKSQITHRLEKLYPGLNIGENEKDQLYTHRDTNVLYQGLIKVGLTQQELLKRSNEDLADLFGYQRKDSGIKRIKQLKAKIKRMLPRDEVLASEELRLLKRDVRFMRFFQRELEQIEERIVRLAKRTPARFLMGQISGVSDLYAGLYVGLIGNFRKYKNASHVLSKAGMCPAIHQSGSKNSKSFGITKAGNAYLRAVLFRMAATVICNDSLFKNYFYRIKKKKHKYWKVYRIAVANKLNRVLFALMRDKTIYKPLGTSFEDIS